MESLNDALIACVKAAGGSANVGPKLWPEKTRDAAQRLLLDCLNDDRPAKLCPEQVMLILRLARAKGCHIGVGFILDELGSAPTTPVEPKDEMAELQRLFIEASERMSESTAAAAKIAERMQQLQPMLRSVS